MKRKSLVFFTVAAAALVFASAAWALRFTDESYMTPVGTVGSSYSFTFTGAGGCGPAPFDPGEDSFWDKWPGTRF